MPSIISLKMLTVQLSVLNEALVKHAGEAGGAVLKRVGTVVGSAIDGFEAVQNYRQGKYRVMRLVMSAL